MEEKEVYLKIANNIKNLIAQANIQQKEFASAIGEKPSTVNMWCKGNAVPQFPKLCKIADYFGVPVTDVIYGPSVSGQTFSSACMKIGLSDERFQKIVLDYFSLPTTLKGLACTSIESVLSVLKTM